MKTSDEIDNRLNTILEGYKQRSSLQNSLQTCDEGDYGKDSEKGRLLTSILTQMEAVELKTLANIVKLSMLFEPLCKKQGIAVNRLNVIRFFRPYQVIEQALSNCKTLPRSFSELKCHTHLYNVLVQRPKQSKESKELSGLISARHLVQFNGDVYDVVAMIQALIRMWSLVLESNLDCEKHTFLNQSKSVEVDMWVNGGFFEAATKLLPPAKNNKPAPIAIPELTVIKKDIQNRLKRIDLHYAERYDYRDDLRKLCGSDARERTEKHQSIIFKMQVAEDHLLHELYHLGDNVKKYLKKCNRIDDFKVVESFEPYRWCGNYVNSLKHGSRGKNRPSATEGYQFEIYDQKGPKPTVEDRIVECLFMINFDGTLETGMEIAHRLIDMWLLFLKYHSDVELASVTERVNSIRRNEFMGKSLYSAKIPDGVLDDARRQAQERRRLNL